MSDTEFWTGVLKDGSAVSVQVDMVVGFESSENIGVWVDVLGQSVELKRTNDTFDPAHSADGEP